MNGTGVIFDLDGTLLDSMSVWRNVAERYLDGLSVGYEEGLSERVSKMSFSEGAQYLKERYLPARSVVEIEEGVSALIGRAYGESIPLKQGAGELVTRLYGAHIPMAVATSNSGRLAMSALRRLGIDGCFSAVITSDEISLGKCSPEIYLEAARRIGTEIAETWVAEDAPHAVATAKRAGFRVAAVCDGFWKDRSAFTSADMVIEGEKGYSDLFSRICGT